MVFGKERPNWKDPKMQDVVMAERIADGAKFYSPTQLKKMGVGPIARVENRLFGISPFVHEVVAGGEHLDTDWATALQPPIEGPVIEHTETAQSPAGFILEKAIGSNWYQ